MNGYTKLFTSLLSSSIWTEDDQTRILWITMLAMADKNGEIQASIPGLARMAGISIDATTRGIEKFLSPDAFSRTPDCEGRRIEIIPGGWEIINHRKYRELAGRDDQKEKNAARQARWRNRNAPVTQSNAPVTQSNAPVTQSNAPVTPNMHIAEAEAKEVPPVPPQGGRRDGAGDSLRDSMPTAAAAEMHAIMARINELHPSWKKRPTFTRSEMELLMSNARLFAEMTEPDWRLLKSYMHAVIPDSFRNGNPRDFWQPDHRRGLIEHISSVLSNADRWATELRKRKIPMPELETTN